jgi:hypothetical protein
MGHVTARAVIRLLAHLPPAKVKQVNFNISLVRLHRPTRQSASIVQAHQTASMV